jgi:hypothetical protein
MRTARRTDIMSSKLLQPSGVSYVTHKYFFIWFN